MHPSLAKHLHSEECNILIDEYNRCRDENRLMRFFGSCGDLEIKVTKCLKKELEYRRKQGTENARKRELDYYQSKNQKSAEK